MKQLHAVLGGLLGGLLVLTLGAQTVASRGDRPAVVLGTFDSRAVAVAYVRSDAFEEELRSLRSELERARAGGNEERVAELEALGPALQKRAHEQGFGAAPIDDVLARIEDQLPGIAREAGVHVIVSKWRLAYSSPEAEVVDVTDWLVAEFDPTSDTLKTIRELRKQDPVPLEELRNHDH